MTELAIDHTWTLFLDRDGVINQRIVGDYVRNPKQFEWLPGVLPALKYLTSVFGKTVVVTNQQGVGKGLMTEDDLRIIHGKMLQQASFAGADIDKVYACTGLAADQPPCRKPRTGMAEQAKQDFPSINFAKSIMVGDSHSDMGFGKAVGMTTVFIGRKRTAEIDFRFDNLWDFAEELSGFTLVG